MRVWIRALSRRSGFAALLTVIVATGFGATVALFGVVNAVFLEPLPYPDAHRLLWLRERHAEVPARPISYPTFLDWQARNEAFSGMSTIRDLRMRLTGETDSRVVDIGLVSADFFGVMRVAPVLGRAFSATEDNFGAERVAVVSYGFWESELAGSAASINTNITLNDVSYTVIGVTPQDFQSPGDHEAWILVGQQAAPSSGWQDRSVRIAGFVIARLNAGVTVDQARADMERVQGLLAEEFPRTVGSHGIEILPLREVLFGDLRTPSLLCFGAVSVLLLIVCANVANLLLLRGLDRRSELAVRVALGASPARAFFELAGEGLFLVMSGSLIGLPLALVGITLLHDKFAQELSQGSLLDWTVFAFAAGLAVVLGIATSLLAAVGTRTEQFQLAIKEGGRSTVGRSTSRTFLLFSSFQSALAVLLLIGAALLLSSMSRIANSDLGFDKDNVLTFRLLLPREYQGPEALNQLYSRIIEDLETIAGVSVVAVHNELPGLDHEWQTDIAPEIQGETLAISPGEEINVDWRIVSEGYFEAMGIALQQGRSLTAEEAEGGAPVMLVDANLASRFWPEGDALGSRIRYDSPTPIEIIGIVDNVREYGNENLGRITIYTPYGRFPFLGDVGVAIRADGIDSTSMFGSVRERIRSIDPGIAVFDVSTLDFLLRDRLTARMLLTQVIAIFAGFATVLAAIGVYGVMSFVLSQGSRELAVRMALGASPRNLVALIMRRGISFSVMGVVVGLLAAVGLSRFLSGMLFQVDAVSARTYLSVAAFSLIVAAAACALPAIRAARVDSLVVLRSE